MNPEHNFVDGNYEEISGFVGYRIIRFTQTIRDSLKEIAEVLTPHEEEIVEKWMQTQFSAWKPPTLTYNELKLVFGELFRHMLGCMRAGELEECIEDFARVGAYLAKRDFPYEALIISLHFLEESYVPILLKLSPEKTLKWLIGFDEFLHVALAAIATSYFQSYRKELLEEAEVGRLVQEGLLPIIPKRLADLEVASVYISARERAQVGGDLIDVFALDQGEIAFIIGDLSGHGLEAATDAARLRFMFRGFMRENPDLVATMTKLNLVLKTELAGGHFATALAGVYDGSGSLRLVGAGHPNPIICDDVCRILEPDGVALAVDERSVYTLKDIRLEVGAMFVVYTDGLIEARSEEGFFGEQRVIEAVSKMHNETASSVAEYLRDKAIRYTKGKLIDDVAILVFKRTAP